MHERVVFSFGEFKSRKCYGISFSRDYTSQGQKNKKALKNQGFSWLYLFYSPYLVAGRGFFIALRRRIVVCRASIHSARHTPCFVRSRCAKRILNPFCLLAPDLLRRSVGLYTTQQPTKKGHRLVSFSLVAGRGFEPPDLRVMSPTSYQAALPRDITTDGGAGDRSRTGTILSYHGILSPGRLPIPPHRQLIFRPCTLL